MNLCLILINNEHILKRSRPKNILICPECVTENSVCRTVCTHCGAILIEVAVSVQGQTPGAPPPAESKPAPSLSSMPSSPPPPRPAAPQRKLNTLQFSTKYTALKGIASLCNTIAVIMAVLASILGFVGFILLFTDGGLGLLVMLMALVFGVSSYVLYKLVAESIFVILDIEMNTRQTAAYMKYLIDHQ